MCCGYALAFKPRLKEKIKDVKIYTHKGIDNANNQQLSSTVDSRKKNFENLKKLPLSNLVQLYGDEQIYGTQGASALGEPLAEGGIAGLSGGDKSGPPPERGPNSEGLSSLLKRGTNI